MTEWWNEDAFGNECWSTRPGSFLPEPHEIISSRTAQKSFEQLSDDCSDDEDSDGSVIILDSDSSTDPYDITFPVIKSELCKSKTEIDFTRSKIMKDFNVEEEEPCAITFPKLEAVVKTEVECHGTFLNAEAKSSDYISNAGYSHEIESCTDGNCVEGDDDEIIIVEEHLANNSLAKSKATSNCKKKPLGNGISSELQDCDLVGSTVDTQTTEELLTENGPVLETLKSCSVVMERVDLAVTSNSSKHPGNSTTSSELQNGEIVESASDTDTTAEMQTEHGSVLETLKSCSVVIDRVDLAAASNSSKQLGNGTVNCAIQNCGAVEITVDPGSAAEYSVQETLHIGSDAINVICQTCSPCKTTLRQPVGIHICKKLLVNSNHISRYPCVIGRKWFACSSCGKKLSRKTSKIHVCEHTCSVCKLKFFKRAKLEEHMHIHKCVKPFSCTFCNSKFTSNGDLKRHMHVHTQEKPFSCPVCKLEFTRKSSLKSHMRLHTGEKPFSCSICQTKFNRKHNLKDHMYVHTDQKPFSCSVCSSKFFRKTRLENHMRIHTGESPFSCSVCTLKFTCNDYLKAHMHVHTQENLFSCHVCKTKFTLKSSLKRHMCLHTGEKPFPCSICKTKFTWKRYLIDHMRVHTGEKPFSCSVCKTKFTRKSHLKVHMRLHTGEKPFSCSICKSRFNQKVSLERHNMSVHRGE